MNMIQAETPPESMNGDDASDTIVGSITAATLLGVGASILFFGALVVWSFVAPLAGAVIASGQVAPEGATRTVQHLEGGIVRDILVREGQVVEAGQPLVRLQDVAARSELTSLWAQIAALEVKEKRLVAESTRDGNWGINWSVENAWEGKINREYFNRTVANERMVFELRRKSLKEETGVYDSRVEQLRLKIDSNRDQIAQLDEQIVLINKEIGNVKTLLDKGLERMPRLFSLQRRLHELKERQARNHGFIAEAREKIGDFRLRKLNVLTRRQEEIGSELNRLHINKSQLQQRIASLEDVVARTDVTAPVAGSVANIRVNTAGGVLAPGSPILDIVPEDEPMIVKARVQPTDIDQVRTGQKALIQLSAYSFRTTEPLPGVVETVSADLKEEEPVPSQMATRASGYPVRVQVSAKALDALPPEVRLTAGMPVEVYLTTDERSFFEYLTEPILQYVNRAMREP